MANTSIVEQSDDIEIDIQTSPFDLRRLGISSIPSIGQNYPITLRFSFSDIQNQGLNVAVESYMENTPIKKVIQNTYSGFFIHSYDVAPSILSINIAAEMPVAALKLLNLTMLGTNAGNSIFTAANATSLLNGLGSVLQVQGLSLLAQPWTIPSPGAISFPITFIDFMTLLQTITNDRDIQNAKVYYIDFSRKSAHEIIILDVTDSGNVGHQNVITYGIQAVIPNRQNSLPSALNAYSSFFGKPTLPTTYQGPITAPPPVIAPDISSNVANIA